MSAVLESATFPPDEQRLVLYSVDWGEYEKIAEALTGRHVRLSYDRGVLEFMTISPEHARLSRFLARLIYILTEELGMLVVRQNPRP